MVTGLERARWQGFTRQGGDTLEDWRVITDALGCDSGCATRSTGMTALGCMVDMGLVTQCWTTHADSARHSGSHVDSDAGVDSCVDSCTSADSDMDSGFTGDSYTDADLDSDSYKDADSDAHTDTDSHTEHDAGAWLLYTDMGHDTHMELGSL